MSEKQAYVVNLLEKFNVNMPTRDIISIYNEKNKDSISERHVQRIRKWYRANNVESKGENMNQEDVFDTKDSSMHEWELDVVNMANEGLWSISDLSERVQKTPDEIRNTIKTYHWMINEKVLDEEAQDVYFNSNITHLPADEKSTIEIYEEKETETETVNEDDNDDYWEVKIDCVDECSKAEKEIDVFMNKLVREKSMRFMKWAKNIEWLAYLIGEKKDDGYYVHDLYLPDQRTSSVLVDKVVADNYNQMKVIGVIHSHHEMGAGDEDSPSFSGHDTNFINGNHNLSLLAGKNGNNGFKIVGIARSVTPCGSRIQIKACVKGMKEEPDQFEKELKNEFFGKVFNKKNKEEEKGSYHFTNRPTVHRA